MEELTAEDLSQRIFDMQLLDRNQIDTVWAEFRTRDVNLENFQSRILQKGLLTNFQIDKLLKGDREGYFYGKYRVLYMIGAGTFARVFRSVDPDTENVVALKVLRARFRNEPSQVEQFLREAKMGQRLKHINIVRVHDVSDDIRHPFMVMDFVEGQTLREFTRVRKKFDVPTAVSFMTDIASGLAYASQQGITHRDLKLSNVLVTSKGRAKLVDFGLATISEEHEKEFGGNPNARAIDYVALERGTHVKKNDHRSDIYFAGCIFYHLLTGVPPLTETRDRLQRMNVSRFQQVQPVNKLEPDLPAYIVTIVNRSMAFRPDNRYQEANEMLVELKQAVARLEAGDQGAVEEIWTSEKPDVKPAKRVANEGDGFTVMLVESEMEMQDLLREQLKKRGYRVLITADPKRAIDRFLDEPEVADCVIFSTQKLRGSAVAAFNQLGEIEATKELPAVLLVDKRQRQLIEAAKHSGHRVLMALPFKVLMLRRVLRKLLTAANHENNGNGEDDEVNNNDAEE